LIDTQKMSPMMKRVRAYFAPVDRDAKQPTLFDPAEYAGFLFDSPPLPWIDLGWIFGFARTSETKIAAVKAGMPATIQVQVRTDIEAKVEFNFESWGKLQLALSAGTQQMNLLKIANGVAPAAVAVVSGSTATEVQLTPSDAASFSVGDWVAVDVDNANAMGFIGSGVSGAYLKSALSDVDYVRRITLNVGRIAAIEEGALTLEQPLLAGAPTSAMKVRGIVGFCDREGSSFFQEWSALFVGEGQQGERIFWHYPRLQALSGIGEKAIPNSGGFERVMLSAAFRALPVKDPIDNEIVVCYRSYVAG
jgi:hypothetical protein